MYTLHKVSVAELELNLRDVTEDLRFTKVKLESIEENLPKMVREMIDFYVD